MDYVHTIAALSALNILVDYLQSRCPKPAAVLGWDRLVRRGQRETMHHTRSWFGGATAGMKALVALACIAVLVSSGCSVEGPNPPSDSHKESKKAQGPARDQARSGTPETTAEAAKPATKKAAQRSEPKPEPNPKSVPSQGPKSDASQASAIRPARATVLVRGVVDGDTIEISPAVNGLKDVRLIGVDTPETVDPSEGVEPYGPQASDFATRELALRRVRLEFNKERMDRYGRLLAYVYVGGSMFNEELVAKGYAQAYPLPAQHGTRGAVRGGAAQGQSRGAGDLGAHQVAEVRAGGPGQRHRRGQPGVHGRFGTTAGPRGELWRQTVFPHRGRLRLLGFLHARAGPTPTAAGRSLRV